MTKKDLALEIFRSFQTGKKSTKKVAKEKIGNSTDPQLLGSILSQIVNERDWEAGLAEGNLFSLWSSVVGDEIASHTSPLSILDGVLTIQTTSTAWAVQLRIVSPDLLASIQKSAPGVLVDTLFIIGPQGPTWKKGLRTIRGAQGPRDTYG
jgi:predicted nucleic acid-binding Zn ribbon protein